ncbi:gliding motility-associated C-terminal domain-containing protein [Mucilaginibacter sabulilitoris]|uniref:Gliding motility-associated C-terminal domain-containing protein n=1 Tax=Mucilaginibacter sabulilitoris TaxID=1173583 RepID=A0ABZ0TQR5_9SPHI|nr:gliding motility-associated C-terminal domain-containing protein [Mucilaginibacter sabulilitoris]WPU95473.1 gliding motility-associated C-terminal domain-containing protein [Mucilaginibacter sabulilitoris]
MPYLITFPFKKGALLVFILVFFSFVKGYGQQFYVAAYGVPLQRVTLTPNGPVSVSVGGCGANDFFSIAILGNKLYYSNASSMFVGDITGGDSPTITNCTFLGAADFGNALTVDKQGILYYARGNLLYSFNPTNKKNVFIGAMPYTAQGDLVFYNNELYMAAAEGIAKINLANVALSKLWVSIPNESIYSLTATSVNGVIKVYAFTEYPVRQIYELDMQKRVIKAIVGVLPYQTLDAASDSEAGAVKYIEIDHVKISQECDVFNKGRVEIVAKPHINNYKYTLNTGQINQTGIFDNLSPGNYTVTIRSNGTEPPNPVNFNVPDYSIGNPVIIPEIKNPVCSIKGNIKLSAGTASATHRIRFNDQIYDFDHTFTDLLAGTYHFTILNENGCVTDEKDYTLTQGYCPQISITNILIQPECDIFNRGNVKVSTAPHAANYKYTLNGITNTTGVFDNLFPGNYVLTVSSDGIEEPISEDVVVPDYSNNSPTVTFITINPLCDIKGSIKLDAGAANTSYKIRYNGQVFGFDHTFNGLNPGSYHFTILRPNGCIADEKDYILQQDDCPPIIINNVEVQAECNAYGQASVKVITQNHPDTYTYTLNNVSNNTGIFNFLTPGTYTVTVSSSGGDHKEQQVTVPDFTLNKPHLTYKVKAAVCTLLGEIKFSVNGNGEGAVKVRHNNGFFSISETIKGLTPGANHFTILNQQDCILDEIDVNVTQDKCEPVVFPNAFTPNGDGINDLFRPNQESNPLNFKLYIYNRWGSLMFQSQSIYNGWDGTEKGNQVPFGVYYWIATYNMPDGKSARQNGTVTLIR